MSITGTIPEDRRETFSIDEMAAVLMDKGHSPFGFFVSHELWASLTGRVAEESSIRLGTAPITLHGLKLAIDPDLSATQFAVAYTEDAWRNRLVAISSPQTAKDDDRGLF
ncbi:hypothetical protein OOZ54_13230 [Rhodopseudomonas palustris]|uniref:hypothetical protein n=1 Tax=Rhodopseudomonas palustris TaxID=1076 RepID=UPI0022F12678|nr:hypothetical protein [Rhodopseudomonas palustris]WBU27626.1 hypothetical protein OOZ54_13230 [Rhodopseudomonas palustris]